MKVVVTGGAGYIGSHVVRSLRDRGDEVVVVDDLSGGAARPLDGASLVTVDLVTDAATAILQEVIGGADAVIHFAARKSVEESVRRPAKYYRDNLGALAAVLLAVEDTGVREFIFSSSAAVYGQTGGSAIRETDSTLPINPYGATKLAGEHLTAAATDALQLRSASLRYFNAAGTGSPELADRGKDNLIPAVIDRIMRGEPPVIFGDDYPTGDGTCIRDYIHPLDLAEAHIAVLDFLHGSLPGHEVFNVGTGTGASVAQVVAAINGQLPAPINPAIRPRRAGDAAVVVADVAKIHDRVGWASRFDLDDIVSSACRAARVPAGRAQVASHFAAPRI